MESSAFIFASIRACGLPDPSIIFPVLEYTLLSLIVGGIK